MQRNPRSGHLALFSTLLCWSVLVAGVEAHDLWITMDRDDTAIHATIHHGHPGDRKRPDPDKLFECDLYASRTAPSSLLRGIKSTIQDGLPVLITDPLSLVPDSDVLLAARYDNGYWVKARVGYRNTSKRQVPDAEESFSSLKYAKALVRGSRAVSDFYGTVVGHRLELIPLGDPFGMKPGEMLPVRVQFEGKPVAGAWVELGDGVTLVAERDIPRYQTDREGVAVVRIERPGLQVLAVDHRIPSSHPELAMTELHNATLSFATHRSQVE